MSLAIGGVGSRIAAKNPFFVDVRDFGARADGTTDNTAAFQSAVDALAAKIAADVPPGLRTKGTVFIPAAEGIYRLRRPIWVDSPFIEVRGEGQGTRVATFANECHSLFIFGLRRQVSHTQNGQTRLLVADEQYRPDAFGKLDATAAPSSGFRWGFRSRGDAFIQSQVSPLVVGARSLRQDWTADNWTETRRITIEFAIEGPLGKIPGNYSIFAIGTTNSDFAYPVIVYTDSDNRFVVRFGTQDVPFAPQVNRRFTFSSGEAVGVQRIAIQIDLDEARVSAYVNSVQVATNNDFGPGWRTGLLFAENDYYPLLIADNGGNRPQLGTPNGFDFSVYGFLFSRSLRYRISTPGSAQERVDGGAINDEYRYFTPRYGSNGSIVDPGLLGYLEFRENPAARERVLNVRGGTAANDMLSSAYLIHAHLSTPGGILDNGLHDLHLIGGHLYGQNVAVGQVLDLEITGVRSTNAYHGIGALANGANYTVRVENCVLDATDSGYFGLNQGLWMRNVTFAGAGRATMRFAGCVVNAQNCFVGFWAPNNQSTVKMHASDYGGNYTIQNVLVDYEGDAYSHTAFFCEAHPFAAMTTLYLKDINLGTVGNAALITLRDGKPGFPPAHVFVDNMQTYSSGYRAILDIESSKWTGEMKGLGVGNGTRTAGPTPSRVVIHEGSSGGPPRDRFWSPGAHAVHETSTAPGRFTEWRCVKAGTFGTPSPPTWVGVQPAVGEPGQVGAYILNHGYLSIELS
ncbi:MAG: glycosyl hydrolase family 28-related protein [Isosphaeraceae bacterium]|nr:glycosyl hydrolase family 28-related protein [Isosphaeraceae bacterium]